MTMMTDETFEYEQYVQEKLKPHPPGRTLPELSDDLPDERGREELQEVLHALEERGVVAHIGKTWRWMQF